MKQPSGEQDQLVRQASAYLYDALGVGMVTLPDEPVTNLPFALTEAFALVHARLLDHRILLAIPADWESEPLSQWQARVDRLAAAVATPVLLLLGTLPSFDRRRLVERRMAFVVPGAQLFLPPLGVDFREHVRRSTAIVRDALSPSTQAILLALLQQRRWSEEWSPSRLAEELGYSAMTASRALRELQGAGLVELRSHGRERRACGIGTAADAWRTARARLRAPVQRTVWFADALADDPAPLAGLSALAEHTLLAPPRWPVRAISAPELAARVAAGREAIATHPPDGPTFEVWRYTPPRDATRNTVDPLSLILSLEADQDPRVALAVAELEAGLVWS